MKSGIGLGEPRFGHAQADAHCTAVAGIQVRGSSRRRATSHWPVPMTAPASQTADQGRAAWLTRPVAAVARAPPRDSRDLYIVPSQPNPARPGPARPVHQCRSCPVLALGRQLASAITGSCWGVREQEPQGGRMDGNSGPVVLINLFEVPAGAEEGFIGAWERARDFLSPRTATGRPSCTRAWAQTPSSGSSTWPNGRRRRLSRRPSVSRISPVARCRFPPIPASTSS